MTRDIFTAREHAIARMVVEGYDNKDIGRQLNKSTNMVKNLMRPMYTKSGMSSRLELALWYLHHFSKTLVLVVLLGALAIAQVTAPTTKPIVASDFGRWTIPAATPVASAGVRTVQLQFSSATASSGPAFSPVSNNTPLLIVDQGNNETVVPTSVNCPMGGVSCSFTATFAHAHPGNFLVSSGTFGLQEAVNYLLGNNGGTVQLTSDWPGNSTTITTVVGGTNVSLQDIRNGLTVYTWNGSVYTAVVVNSFNCGTTANPGIPFWNGNACLVDTNSTLDGNGNAAFVSVTATGAVTGSSVGTTGPGGILDFTLQTAPATPSLNHITIYGDSGSGKVTCLDHVLANCFTGGGGGITFSTNAVNNSSQTLLNFVNPAAFNGLNFTYSNPSGGNQTFGITGTLNNAGLTNPFVTVNSQTCTLGASCNIAPAGLACSARGSSDTINTASVFATTCSLSNSGLAPGSFLEIRAHGVYTTTSTPSPTIKLRVNAGGTTGICSNTQVSDNPGTGITNGPWEALCYIQIVTTGAPGTAIAWGREFFSFGAGGQGGNSPRDYVNASTVAFNTSAPQTVSIEETATPVAGQTWTLQSLVIRNY